MNLEYFFSTFYVKCRVSTPYYAVLLFKLDLTQNLAYSSIHRKIIIVNRKTNGMDMMKIRIPCKNIKERNLMFLSHQLCVFCHFCDFMEVFCHSILCTLLSAFKIQLLSNISSLKKIFCKK